MEEYAYPEGRMDKPSMDGALRQFSIELDYLDKSIAGLADRLSPILQDASPEVATILETSSGPGTDLRRLLDRLGGLRVCLDKITDRVDL